MQVGGDPPVELSNASPKFDGAGPWGSLAHATQSCPCFYCNGRVKLLCPHPCLAPGSRLRNHRLQCDTSYHLAVRQLYAHHRDDVATFQGHRGSRRE